MCFHILFSLSLRHCVRLDQNSFFCLLSFSATCQLYRLVQKSFRQSMDCLQSVSHSKFVKWYHTSKTWTKRIGDQTRVASPQSLLVPTPIFARARGLNTRQILREKGDCRKSRQPTCGVPVSIDTAFFQDSGEAFWIRSLLVTLLPLGFFFPQ